VSKLNRKEFKKTLSKWKIFLNENRIFSQEELIQTLKKNKRSEKEIKYFVEFWNNNKFITKYTQVIQNELRSTQEPIKEILDVCKLHYEKIYQSAGPKIKDLIGGGNISIDELRKQIDSKISFNKNEVRQQCAYQSGKPIVGSYQDFDVVYSGRDWIVIEPKTIQGSIAWTHGKPDGSEETDQKRRSGWCTGVSTGNNMFPNYAGNLHMFYFITADYDNDNSVNRRLCLSYTVSEGEAILEENGGSTVNAANQAIDAELINRIVDKNILDLIENRVSSRKETSFAEIYSKATLDQILRIEKQMNSQGLGKDIVNQEIANYLKHTDKKKVINHIITNYKEELIYNDLIYYDAPLPFSILERNDIFSKLDFDDLISKLSKTYKNKEHANVYFCIMISFLCDHQNFDLIGSNFKDEMINYFIENPNDPHEYISELILSNNANKESNMYYHNSLNLNDIVKILTVLSKLNYMDQHGSILQCILQEFDFSQHKDQKEYNQIKEILKSLFPKLTYYQKKYYSNHDYIFENPTLKKYIKLILS
tara:strand:- start:2193 stop:3800 length:1608 start_codon:yes stop_codon:yes gene_type:complete